MVKRGLVVFSLVLIGIFLFSINFVSAEVVSCSVTGSSSCGGTVVMRLSATTNAHGSLPSSSSYPYVLCCNGNAGETTTCTGNNKIIS